MKKILTIVLLVTITMTFVNAGAGGDAWRATKKVSVEAWDETKEGTKEVWKETKKTSIEAWDETKDGSKKVWKKTKEESKSTWEKVKEFFK
jgi:gas vesicle protein